MKMQASLILGLILLGSVLLGTPKYTLMNAYAPPAGVRIGTIEFVGKGGARHQQRLDSDHPWYHGQFEISRLVPASNRNYTL